MSLAQSIELSVTLGRRGLDISASSAMAELQDADWIFPASHGGWRVA
jgi:hypothetical protein